MNFISCVDCGTPIPVDAYCEDCFPAIAAEPPRFTVCVSVGGAVQFYDLTRAEIDDAWRTIQASALPQTTIGWYDERDKWTQLGTKPAKF